MWQGRHTSYIDSWHLCHCPRQTVKGSKEKSRNNISEQGIEWKTYMHLLLPRQVVTENIEKGNDNQKSKQPRTAFIVIKVTCQFSVGWHPFRKILKKKFLVWSYVWTYFTGHLMCLELWHKSQGIQVISMSGNNMGTWKESAWFIIDG